MLRLYYITGSLLMAVVSANAQNLVLNPGFEEHTDCPTGLSNGDHDGLSIVPHWTTPTTSTDYYHTCGQPGGEIPTNEVGTYYQWPHGGEAFVGMLSWSGPFSLHPNSGEYLEGSLSSPLLKDSSYLVELYVNLHDSHILATDEFSILFTDTLFTRYENIYPGGGSSIILDVVPQLHNEPENYIWDQDNWMPLRWVYRAGGGERYFTMGVFRPYELVLNYYILNQPGGVPSCYYFIDDVRIEPLPWHLGQLGLRDTVLCGYPFEVVLEASGHHQNYSWNTGDTGAVLTVTEPGVYVLEGWYGEFRIRDTAVVQYLPLEAVTLGDDLKLCPDELPFLLEGPAGMDTYSWNTGVQDRAIDVQESGWYVLEASYTCGQVRDSLFIEVAQVATFDLGADTLVCGDQAISIPLGAGAGYELYQWSTGAHTPSIVATEPGMYWVEALHFCQNQADTVTVLRLPLQELELGADTLSCHPDALMLEAPAGFDTYQWSNGAEGAVLEVTGYGTYRLDVEYACGILQDSIRVLPAPEWSIQLPEALELNLGEQQTLVIQTDHSRIISYEWMPSLGLSCTDCAAPELTGIHSGIYQVEVKDKYGCLLQDAVRVQVNASKPGIYVPNAFSPNADGVNDKLSIFTDASVQKISSFEVFDRWGGLVWRQTDQLPNDATRTWDGRSQGLDVPAGTYVWQLELELLDG
nr:gliding motility-associated C-terminal domain-containing protein [Saprospiraceae bacterium]